MDNKFKKTTALVFTAIIIASLAICCLINLKSFTNPYKSFKNEEINTSQFINKVKSSYISNVKYKESFININGLYARLTGRKQYNQVAKLKNGMLTYGQRVSYDMKYFGSGISDFNSYLKQSGIDYLYVQAPFKVDAEETLLYPGSVNFANDNANELLDILQKNSVSCIDLRKDMSSNKEQVEKYFYNTDHHWNNDGSFYAFGVLLNHLSHQYPDANIDTSLADKNSWNVTVYKDALLGAHGKRVGKLFAGVDDFLLYTPKFETQGMSTYIPKHKRYNEGSFEDAIVLRKDYIENYDLFNEDPYSSYLGGYYPLVHFRNASAKSDLKILFIKDSFAMPVECFMSTAFKEIDSIDARYFNECRIAEYVEATQPDIVITFINPSAFANKEFAAMGVDNAKAQAEKINESSARPENAPKDITISASKDNKHAFSILVNKASFDTKYKLSFDDVKFLAGDSDCITVALYNSTTKQFAANYVFDIDYCKNTGGFEWTFVSPEKGTDNLQILIYAGKHGETNGNTVQFINLEVIKYS